MRQDKKPLIEKTKFDSYLKYSSLAFQLIGLILIAYWIGSWVDGKMNTDKPYWTAGVIVFVIVGFMVSMIYKLTHEDE